MKMLNLPQQLTLVTAALTLVTLLVMAGGWRVCAHPDAGA
jgi:hypothetical protein